MTDYELFKKLKDAGFPLIKLADSQMSCWDINGVNYMAPSLKELIEACGQEFESLFRVSVSEKSAKSGGIRGGYEALSIYKDKWTWGETAEKAVMKLWLILQEKEKK